MKQFSSDELTLKIQEYIRTRQLVKEPIGVYEPIRYVLGLGGKRIRPVLLLLAYNIYNEDVERMFGPALALEAFHNFTLVHDDLMDRAELRRNQATVHKKWNDNTAVLSGDLMLIKAYEWMVEACPPDRLKDVMHEFIKVSAEVCEGQQWDMDFENRRDVTVDDYMEMIRLKTSVLLAASLKIGALLAGAPKADTELLYDFGLKMGLAFQLQDDWLDVYADSNIFGKMTGGDIVCNKKTFMLITALNEASDQDRKALCDWLDKVEFDAVEKVKSITDIYNRIGISELCQTKIEALYHEGLALLKNVQVDDSRKSYLSAYIESLMNRKV